MSDKGIVLSIVGWWLFFIVVFSVIAMEMFEYVLWAVSGLDIPWFLDLLGGITLNVSLSALWVGCLILRACGIEAPFIQ